MKYAWVVALSYILGAQAHAGAWVQEKGRALLATQAFYYTADSYYDIDGSEIAQPRFNKTEMNLYAEYGWRESVTLGTNLLFNRVTQMGDSNIGLSDPELFARIRLYAGEHGVVSLQPLIKLPSLYRGGGTPRGGTGSTDGELSLFYGRNMPLTHPRDYVDMRIGYRERNNGLNGQYRLDVTYGLHLSENVSIVPAFRGVMASKIEQTAFTNDGELDYDLMKAEVNLYYALTDSQQLGIGYFNHMAGWQTGAGHGFMLGMLQRF